MPEDLTSCPACFGAFDNCTRLRCHNFAVDDATNRVEEGILLKAAAAAVEHIKVAICSLIVKVYACYEKRMVCSAADAAQEIFDD